MDDESKQRSARAMKQALRLLDVEGVYNQLYAIAAQYADDTYTARERLRAVWALILDTIEAGLDDRNKAAQLDQLRDLAGRFLKLPYLQSMALRNLLIFQILDAAYPVPKRPSDKRVVTIFITAFGFLWLVEQYLPELQSFLRYSLVLLGFAFLGWYLLWHRRRALVDHLREELGSGLFNDSVVRGQLEALDRRSPRLPSVIYELLDAKPPTFSEVDVERFRATITTEQWKCGFQIKSEWQKELLREARGGG